MTTPTENLINALVLPSSCRVDQRIAKKLLSDNGAPSAADKRLINEGIEEIQWVAALKPNTVGVAAYRDQQREYLEIAVLVVTLRTIDGKVPSAARTAELVQRAVPYPLVLLTTIDGRMELSLVHKRWAQNDPGNTVIDGEFVTVSLDAIVESDDSSDVITARPIEQQFFESLALTRQPQASLLTLYQGWMDCAQAMLVARLIGSFTMPDNAEQAAVRRQAFHECQDLEAEASRLRALAAKERQMSRQVDLNLALKRVQERLSAAHSRL